MRAVWQSWPIGCLWCLRTWRGRELYMVNGTPPTLIAAASGALGRRAPLRLPGTCGRTACAAAAAAAAAGVCGRRTPLRLPGTCAPAAAPAPFGRRAPLRLPGAFARAGAGLLLRRSATAAAASSTRGSRVMR